MTLNERASHAVSGAALRIAAAWGAIDGVAVERRQGDVRIVGRGLKRRWIDDLRLRFAGLGR